MFRVVSRVARGAATVALCLGSAVSCDSCMKTESHVDVPTTLDAVKKLDAPPDVVVDVQRKTRPKGGGACGHSPLCIIVLPIIVYDAFFPTKYDEATVTEGGAVTYVARFETDGDFIEGTETKDGKARYFGRLELKELGKRVLVQVGEAPLGADGGPGKLTKTPILPQVDLIADYEGALKKEKDGDDRADLIVEAAAWLRDEALPFLEKHTKDPSEPDEQRAEIVKRLCTWKDDKARDTAFRGTGHQPGPKAAIAGATCASQQSIETTLAAPFAEALARMVCDPPKDATLKELTHALRNMPLEPKRAAVKVAQACANPEGRTLARFTVGDRVSVAELEKLAAAGGPASDAFIDGLDPRDKQHRAWLFAALRAKPNRSAILHSLYVQQLVPTAEELVVLVASYLAEDSVSHRAYVLHLFRSAQTKGTSVASSIASLQGALSKTKDEREALHIALVVLGKREHAEAAAAALDSTAHYKDKPTMVSFGTGSLVGYGLRLSGCGADEIRKAYERRKSFSDASRGPLCTTPPTKPKPAP